MTKVLLIDDEESIRFVGRRVLESEGYEVTVANDVDEGMEVFQIGVFDLVITDLMMPGERGLEAVRQISQLEHGLPFIIISGGDLESDGVREAKRRGGLVKTLHKPFELSDFVQAVKASLRARKA